MQNKLSMKEEDTFDIEYLVCHVGLLWRRLLNAKIKSLGISGTEKRTLFCIARYPGLTQIKIATLLDLEPQNLLRSLDKLEQQGWIKKKPDEHDRRAKCLYTTKEAKKIITKIQSFSKSIRPQVLSDIHAENIQLVIKYLSKIRENILKQLEPEEGTLLSRD